MKEIHFGEKNESLIIESTLIVAFLINKNFFRSIMTLIRAEKLFQEPLRKSNPEMFFGDNWMFP